MTNDNFLRFDNPSPNLYTKGAGYAAGIKGYKQAKLRQRVLRNIAESQKARASSNFNKLINFDNGMTKALTLDISTPKNGAVFWTGWKLGNNVRAENWASRRAKKTLNMTPGGGWLDTLYGSNNNFTRPQIDIFAKILSERFAEGASGKVNSFIKGTAFDLNTTYYGTELPILNKNSNVSVIINRGGH